MKAGGNLDPAPPRGLRCPGADLVPASAGRAIGVHTCWIVFWLLCLPCASIAVQADGEPVTALAYHPSGGLLIGGSAGRLESRDGVSGRLQTSLELDLPKVGGVAFGGGGRWLAAVGGVPGEAGRVLICDGRIGRVLSRQEAGADVAMAVAVDPAGVRLAVGGMDRVVRVWSVSEEGGRLGGELRLEGHTGPVLAVAFGGGGDRVLTASADRTVGVWNLGSGRRERSLGMHTEPVRALALRPVSDVAAAALGGKWECATGGDDRTVRIWQPAIGRMVRIVRGHEGSVLALAYAPDGGSLYTLGREGILRRFEAGSDRCLWEHRVGGDWGFALAVSPDGGRVASGDAVGGVRVTVVGSGVP